MEPRLILAQRMLDAIRALGATKHQSVDALSTVFDLILSAKEDDFSKPAHALIVHQGTIYNATPIQREALFVPDAISLTIPSPAAKRRVLFKLLYPQDNRQLVIYDNGETEGFEPGAVIFNYHPLLVQSALVGEGNVV